MGELVQFQEVKAMAAAIAKSGLFGVRDENQALALMLLAQAEGMHPMRAVQEYHIINGRPALRADAMLARFLNAGGRVEWHRLDNEMADATFTHPSGGTARITWTLEDAKRAGLIGKSGGNWEKYPRAMLRARCVSEGIRTVAPGVVVGLYTPEEVAEFESPAMPAAPTPTDAVGSTDEITMPQIKKISVMLRELGLTEREESRAFCGWLLGRDDVTSVKQLSKQEASRLIEMLADDNLMSEKIGEWIEIQARAQVEANEQASE